MSENIVFPCPACGTKYSVAPHHAGKQTKCKKCSAPITVPSPEVENPTIAGGTRTIRRADIDRGAGVPAGVRGGAQPKVDMSGGSSVLRKRETVVGAPPVAGARHGGTRPPRHAGAAPRPMPGGRPMPPGMYPPRKKNNTPMIIGIISGVVALVMIVVLIVVVTGDDDVGPVDNDGELVADNTPEVDEAERLYEELNNAFNNKAGLDDVDRFVHYYKLAKENADNPRIQPLQAAWAGELATKARRDADSVKLAEIALMLDDDGYDVAQSLLEKAWQDMAKNKTATVSYTYVNERGVEREGRKASPLFEKVITRLGWVKYEVPPEIEGEYLPLEVEGTAEYMSYYDTEIDSICREVDLYQPHVVEELKELADAARRNYEALVKQDNEDGFAIAARKAWIRFKQKYSRGGVVDRMENKRAFTPEAMKRKGEDFEDIWTYTYWKPFIVFVEKPKGMRTLEDDFLQSLKSKADLLRDLHDWFQENLVKRFDLKRVKPQYNAEQAEEEGWPLEIVVLRNEDSFQQFLSDATGGNPIPGARAMYSPLLERVMTWDDRDSMDEETQWFNESVLIHEAFHMLSDFYTANPMFDPDEYGVRPHYANILVQEGLTDSVAGFVKSEGDDGANYEFLKVNHLRLQSFQNVHEFLGGNPLYRIRDMLPCRDYAQVRAKGGERAIDLLPEEVPDIIAELWGVQNGMSIFYAEACLAAYFFHHYEEDGVHPYRDKWWTYVGMDYSGEIYLSSMQDNSGIAAFEEIFEIESEEDWDELDRKWLEYTHSLNAEDVGKSGGGDELKDPDELDRPGEDRDPSREDQRSVVPGVPEPQGRVEPSPRLPAYAGREED